MNNEDQICRTCKHNYKFYTRNERSCEMNKDILQHKVGSCDYWEKKEKSCKTCVRYIHEIQECCDGHHFCDKYCEWKPIKSIWKATSELRYAKSKWYKGALILQQKWVDQSTGKSEWRTIPTVSEEAEEKD